MALNQRHTILIVDDEASIIKALQRLFHKENYEILTALNGEEALVLLQKSEKPVSLIISDQRMPGMSGSEFLEKAKAIFPEAIRMLLTGYADMAAIVDAVNKGEIHRYFSKPWDDNGLLMQVRQALEHYELVAENKRLLDLTQTQNMQLSEFNRNLEKMVKEQNCELINRNMALSYLNKELENGLFNTARAFSSLGEMYDPAMSRHGRRVARLAQKIAEILKVPEEKIVTIEIAALLHDIGKLGLPQTLHAHEASKRSPEKEELLYRRHPEEGQKVLQFISQFDDVGELIRHHHELYDGRGFPDQLSEQKIPLGSRIISVADVYDKAVNLKFGLKAYINEYLKDRNLTQDTLSEEELNFAATVHHIKKGAFSHYDPDVVKALLTLVKESGIQLVRERELFLKDLKEGMTLATSLYSSRGRFLLPYKTVIKKDLIIKLSRIHESDPINDPIYILEREN
jgi:response regulator RpfG family c-di-GMP phosphodiesterase